MTYGRPSDLEETLAFQLSAACLPEPEREFRFNPKRRWRFDFAWPDLLIAAEVEGGVWSGGRHTRGDGFTRDCEKYNTAALSGWTVLRFTGEMVDDGRALETIEDALQDHQPLPRTLAEALIRHDEIIANEKKARARRDR